MVVDIIIGSPTLESLEPRRDLGKCFVTVNIDAFVVQSGFEYERTRERDRLPDDTDSEEFSSIENKSMMSRDYEEHDDAYVVMQTEDFSQHLHEKGVEDNPRDTFGG